MDDIRTLTAENIMKQKVLVLDGIAGSAKTSTTCAVLDLAGIQYVHATSTNKLKSDIEERFGHKAYTVASLLFNNDMGNFYVSQKEVESNVIVIDEILQTSPKVFQWINSHPSKHIVVCTDKQQMLSPMTGRSMLEQLKALEEQSSCMRLHYSYRPVNEQTRSLYDECYAADSDGDGLYRKYGHTFPRIPIDDLQYDVNNTYLCHTNASEKYLYRKFDLYDDYNNPTIIRKGKLAAKETPIVTTYPILPQMQTDGTTCYYQIGNVGSVVRYQGSEVQDGHHLFYIVTPHSVVKNREFYTMITRAKNISDIVFVEAPEEVTEEHKLVSFCGLPVFTGTCATVDTDATEYDPDTYEKALKDINNDPKYFERGMVVTTLCNKNGQRIAHDYSNNTSRGPKIRTLLKKEPRAEVGNIESVYWKIDQIYNAYGLHDDLRGITFTHILSMISPNFKQQKRNEFKYELDLYSAYPQIWHRCGLIDPDSITIAGDEKPGQTFSLAMCLITSGKYKMRVVSEDLLKYLNEHGEHISYEIIFYANTFHDHIGDKLYEMAYKDKETKKRLKDMHYGYMQKGYLKIVTTESNGFVLVRQPFHRYDIQLAFVQSQLALAISQIRYAIYGNVEDGFSLVDALFFNGYNPEMIDKIRSAVPYDFRIIEHHEDGTEAIVYKTYEDLKARSHHKKKEQ